MANALNEARRLVDYMQSLPQFGGVQFTIYNAGNSAFFNMHGWCANHEIAVTWKHKAELGRWTYRVNNRLIIYDQESLVQLIHRDMVMARMGVKA